MRTLPLALCAALLAAAPALASENGRFTVTPAEGGFLRLDTRTGAVAFCTIENGAASCGESADERAALDAEVARLTGENRDLRARLDAAPKARTLPSDEDLDRALSFAEKFMRRMMRASEPPSPDGKT